MEMVCPLCNAMQAIEENCPCCGQLMIDGGSVNNYLGPYSPYVETASLPFQSAGHCVHLLYCPVCDYDVRVALALVSI
ncbi:hypothetical protein [Sporomusa sp.]|jgi:hypothetical protein|uniref:hypothetical protein n=1 Tax=Sporomusa sp. TaxID=2078658 RepID=UPI002D1815D2|nr:hypothetical protein [Sporomusa sp.]HWR10117.1 hypothetical protein [Sporomusa sp.]